VYKKSDGQIEIFGVFNGIHRSYDRYGFYWIGRFLN